MQSRQPLYKSQSMLPFSPSSKTPFFQGCNVFGDEEWKKLLHFPASFVVRGGHELECRTWCISRRDRTGLPQLCKGYWCNWDAFPLPFDLLLLPLICAQVGLGSRYYFGSMRTRDTAWRGQSRTPGPWFIMTSPCVSETTYFHSAFICDKHDLQFI